MAASGSLWRNIRGAAAGKSEMSHENTKYQWRIKNQ